MITGRYRFNVYLLIACAALLAFGCQTEKKKEVKQEKKEEKPKEKKQLSNLRIHMEVSEMPGDFSTRVPIYRKDTSITVNVDKDPFLTEVNVTSAKVMDVIGGFALRIEFDHEGALLLENYTTANPGRRIAIFSVFGKGPEEHRWLGAPLIAKRITDGVLVFTPDASREEAERIAKGLNNVHEELEKKNKWSF
jgi:preprotein translocase subunit SecD